MPVRIYDIAKNLGIKSKDVLEKAEKLGIQNARVASSSLDKITAEFLELEIAKELKPAEATPSEEEPAKIEVPVDSGPVLIVATKEEPPAEEEPEAIVSANGDSPTVTDVEANTEAPAEKTPGVADTLEGPESDVAKK